MREKNKGREGNSGKEGEREENQAKDTWRDIERLR